MKALDLIKENRPPKILICSGAGSGKTGLVSQASRGYLMDFDIGMRTAANIKDKFSEKRHQIEFDTYRDKDPRYPKAWINAKKKIFEIRTSCDKKTCEYDALIIDSLTFMGNMCYNQIMYQVNKPMGKPSLPDWGLMLTDMRNMLQLITTLPLLVIVTAHEEHFQVGDDTFVKVKTLGQKLAPELPGMFDEVWEMKPKKRPQNKIDWTVSWIPNEFKQIRTRSGQLKSFVINDIGLTGVLSEINYCYD